MFKNAENESEIILKFYFRNEKKSNQWFCIHVPANITFKNLVNNLQTLNFEKNDA